MWITLVLHLEERITDIRTGRSKQLGFRLSFKTTNKENYSCDKLEQHRLKRLGRYSLIFRYTRLVKSNKTSSTTSSGSFCSILSMFVSAVLCFIWSSSADAGWAMDDRCTLIKWFMFVAKKVTASSSLVFLDGPVCYKKEYNIRMEISTFGEKI